MKFDADPFSFRVKQIEGVYGEGMPQAMRQRFSESDVADDLFGLAEPDIFERPMEDVADMIVFNWPQSFAGQQIRILIFGA